MGGEGYAAVRAMVQCEVWFSDGFVCSNGYGAGAVRGMVKQLVWCWCSEGCGAAIGMMLVQ